MHHRINKTNTDQLFSQIKSTQNLKKNDSRRPHHTKTQQKDNNKKNLTMFLKRNYQKIDKEKIKKIPFLNLNAAKFNRNKAEETVSFVNKQQYLNIEIKINNQFRKICFRYDQNTKIRHLVRSIKAIAKSNTFTIKSGNLSIDYYFTLLQEKVEIFKGLDLNLIIHITSNKLDVFPKNSLKRFNILKCIGTGGFSKVFLVQQNGVYMALKVLDKEFILRSEKQQMVTNQRKILIQLNHPLITKLYYSIETEKFLCFAIEFCSGGQLFFLLSRIRRMTQNEARFYFLQVLAALNELHSKNIIYRDLKPENIILSHDGHIKLADFGLSKEVTSQSQLNYSFCGSAEYMSPQMLLKNGHSFTLDYYCLGALLYQLVTGLPPYYSKNQQQLFSNISNKKLNFPQGTQLSAEIKSLITGLLEKNPKKRLGANYGITEILQHPWTRVTNFEDIQAKKLIPPFKPNFLEYNFDDQEYRENQEAFLAQLQNEKNNGDLVLPIFRKFYYENPDCLKKTLVNQKIRQSETQDLKRKLHKKIYEKLKTEEVFQKQKQPKQKILSLSNKKDQSNFTIKKKILSCSKSIKHLKLMPYFEHIKNVELRKHQSFSSFINNIYSNHETTKNKLKRVFLKKQLIKQYAKK